MEMWKLKDSLGDYFVYSIIMSAKCKQLSALIVFAQEVNIRTVA